MFLRAVVRGQETDNRKQMTEAKGSRQWVAWTNLFVRVAGEDSERWTEARRQRTVDRGQQAVSRKEVKVKRPRLKFQ